VQLSLPWRYGPAKPFPSLPRINWAHWNSRGAPRCHEGQRAEASIARGPSLQFAPTRTRRSSAGSVVSLLLLGFFVTLVQHSSARP
jgi:hypothetical protein